MYDLLPPIIPDSIPPSSNGIFEIPITMYGDINETIKTLAGFNINSVQIAIVNQNNTKQKFEIQAGKNIYKNNENKFILKLNSSSLPLEESENENQFYKVQLRYSKQNKQQLQKLNLDPKYFSEWSSICLIKKIKPIELSIKIGNFLLIDNYKVESTSPILPNVFYSINGEMSESSNEILKNYQIIIKKKDDNSGLYLEYFKTDFLSPDNKNTFSYKINKNFIQGSQYQLIINANTTSGYKLETQYYYFTIAGGFTDENEAPFFCQAEVNEEQGSIDVYIVGERNLRKNFIIQRASSEDNFVTWEKMTIVQFIGDKQQPVQIYDDLYASSANSNYSNYTKLTWSDKTVKSGIFYKYAAAALYKSTKFDDIFLAGNYQDTKIKTCIFEDMYLMGKNKSLRIKYNPDINNFKYNITESVQTTLGAKYPFINRTGKNNYRSFQIGGLITTFMDTDSRSNVPSTLDINFLQTKEQDYVEKFFIDNDSYNKLKTLFSDFVIGPTDNIEAKWETITDIENFPSSTIIQVLKEDGTITTVDLEDDYETVIVLYKNKNNYYSKYIFQDGKWKKIINNSSELKSFISSEELFSKSILDYRRVYNTQQNINQYNDIIYEREFREAVYNFLYDPTPKLFRSSQEGNILVRLTNITFSPVKQLGRQLYSFTADAIEIDEYNMDNLYKYKIYQKNEWKPLYQTYEIKMAEQKIKINDKKYQLNKSDGFLYYSSISVRIEKFHNNTEEIKMNINTKQGSQEYSIYENGLILNNMQALNISFKGNATISLQYTYAQEQQEKKLIITKKNQLIISQHMYKKLLPNQDLFEKFSSKIINFSFIENYRKNKNPYYNQFFYCFQVKNNQYIIRSLASSFITVPIKPEYDTCIFKGICCLSSNISKIKTEIDWSNSSIITVKNSEYTLIKPSDLDITNINIIYNKNIEVADIQFTFF